MEHLILGAGASLAQAIDCDVPMDMRPPVMGNFARTMSDNYSPEPLLSLFIRTLQHQPDRDARDSFYELESTGVTDVEAFLQFAWENRELGSKLAAELYGHKGISYWENLLYHGLGSPLANRILVGFCEGGEYRDLSLSRAVLARYRNDDLIVNLNYDTLAEIALKQSNQEFAYLPNRIADDVLKVCKPHGSLNMSFRDDYFAFGQPEWLGVPQQHGHRSFSGLIPPRADKSFAMNRLSSLIVDPVRDRRPERVTFWGVGFAKSDVDILALYRSWLSPTVRIDVVNPVSDVARVASEMFGMPVRWLPDIRDWLAL